MVGGGPVAPGEVVSLEAPPSPVGGPHLSHHHGSASSAPAAAASSSLEVPPLPHGVTWTPTRNGGVDVHSPRFHLLTADLRDVAAVQATLTAAGIDFSLPTLFLSECVLVYLEPEDSCAIIAWAARSFARSTFVTYEQIRPHDAFGQVGSTPCGLQRRVLPHSARWGGCPTWCRSWPATLPTAGTRCAASVRFPMSLPRRV